MKLLTLLTILTINSSIVFASCESINIYKQFETYSDYLAPRIQNYGTCYAEASSYAYNVAIPDKSKIIHPLYFINFHGLKYKQNTVDYGGLDFKYDKNGQYKVCPYKDIKNALNEYVILVNDLFNKQINELNAESDIIAILQAMMILRDADLQLTQEQIVDFFKKIKSFKKDPLYLKHMEALAKEFPYQQDLSVTPRDNALVDYMTISKHEKTQKIFSQKNILFNILKIQNLIMTFEEPNGSLLINLKFVKFFQKIDKIVNQTKNGSIKLALNLFLNDSCSDVVKFNIDENYNNGHQKKNTIDRDEVLSELSSYLKKNLPVKLHIDYVAIDKKQNGDHGVVLMGTRPTRIGSCDILVRNSRGLKYNNFKSCYCFNKSSNKFEACYPLNPVANNQDVLACWYSWDTFHEHLLSYTPIIQQ